MRKRYYIYLIMLIAATIAIADLVILGKAEQSKKKAKVQTPALVR